MGGTAETCGRHRGIAPPELGDGGEEAERPGEAFRRRLEAGDYRGLYGAGVEATIAQAGASGGLDDEIGALRVTLARLLIEEGDAAKLALAVARVAAVAVQAARMRQALGGDDGEEVRAMLARLDEASGGRR